MSTNITVTGNLVEQVSVNFTTQGKAAANFTVADNTRYFDEQAQEWKSTEATFWSIEVFGQMAERAAELEKGERLIVVGKTRTKEWKDREGNRRRELRINASDIARSLKFGPKESPETNDN